MRERPTGDQLLEAALSLLRDEVLPALPAEKRHAALMIANAMGIAMRQLRNGDAPEQQELAALERILLAQPGNDAGPVPSDARDRLLELNRRLSLAIRQGRADAVERVLGIFAKDPERVAVKAVEAVFRADP